MNHIKEFFYLRHGQTDANRDQLLCGRWDIPLNENGTSQAETAAFAIRRSISELGSICVSPLIRARQTAERIAKEYEAELHVIDELAEWNMGEWEKRSYHDLKHLFHSEINPEGGETRAELNDRVKRGLELSFAKPGPVLIVAHGEVWNAVRRVLDIPDKTFIGNCEPHRVSQVNEHLWRVETL